MKEIKIIIEKTSDHFSAYAENVEGIYGAGENVAEVRKSINNAIRLLKKHNKAEKLPSILRGEFKVVYKYDTQSLFNYYKGIFTHSALERITGINQRQLQHYSSGLKRPRQARLKKIESALHQLGHELLSVEL